MNYKILMCVIVAFMAAITCYSQNGSSAEIQGEEYYNEERYSSALPLLQRAAKGGSLKAMTLLSDMYYKGLGVTKSTTIANNLLSKALAKNYPMAYYYKGENLYHNKDYANAIKYLEIAASKNYEKAYEVLGLLYYNGKEIPQDYEKAVYNFRLSAEMGNESSEIMLAFLYYNGIGVEKDHVKSQELFDSVIGDDYEKLARDYNEFGQLLAMLYFVGDGGKKDNYEALKIMDALEQAEPGSTDKELYKLIDDEVNKIVEPSYPGGRDAMIRYVQGQIHAPAMKILRDNGTVIVSVIIDCEGRPYGTRVIKGVNPNLNTQAEKIIQRMPSWTPATKGGVKIEMRVQVPVTFNFD